MSKLFLGGIPTGPDVKLLSEHFGVPELGDEIPHSAVEKILGKKRDSDRYRSVTVAWRKELLNEEGIELAAVPGKGFRALTQNERVDHGIKTAGRGTRMLGRSKRRLAMVKLADLDPVHTVRHDHAVRLLAGVMDHATTMMRELAPPKPVLQLPRPTPTAQKKSA